MSPLLVDHDVANAEALKPSGSFFSLKHRHCRQTACNQAAIGDDGNGSKSLSGPSGSRIEDMAITPAVDFNEALIVPAGRKRAAGQRYLCCKLASITRMTNANSP